MLTPFVELIGRLLPEPHAGLLLGILFGVQTQLPGDLYEALITTGTIHIVVLSGQNIAILTAFLSEVLLVFGRKASILLTLLSVGVYVWFVGAEPPIMRAAIMASLILFSVYFGKQSWSLLFLFFTVSIMLLLNPQFIADRSFQLSVAATVGILLFGPKEIVKKSTLRAELFHYFKFNLQTTLAAQLFTTPLILYHFHRISLVAPITNVLVAWTISPIMISGFLTVISGLIWEPIGILAGFITYVPLSFLLGVVGLTAQIPLASFNW